MVLLCIAILFLALYACLLHYYKCRWDTLPEYLPGGGSRKAFISVVVPARNEAENIILLLQALSLQSYPQENFEIIVVDDFSTDETAKHVRQCALSNLRLIQPKVSPLTSSKKLAIEAAVHCAKGELIVATDADCIVPPGWLSTINDFYISTGAVFIAAPVKFIHTRSILQVFQALDFMVLQGVTGAAVSGSFHSMCNGANLAYTKAVFDEVDGFKGIDKVASGDDMFLMHKVWQRYPQKVQYLKSRLTVVQTSPMLTWSAFFQQRIRWASKTMHYKDKRVFAVLVFVYAFNVLFLLLLVAGFFSTTYWKAALLYWVIKTCIELPFLHAVSTFYQEKQLLRYFFFFQPLHMLYTVSVGLLSQLGKYEWKGRLTK